MEVRSIVDRDFETFDESTTVAKLRGVFRDPEARVLPITRNGHLRGIITRRDVMSSHEPPSRKAGTLTRSVPQISLDEDVRETARLMITADSTLLPVVEDGQLVGVLRADDLLEEVKDSMDALDVTDVMTAELIAIRSDTTLGRTLAMFRDHGVRHLPIVDSEGDPTGIVSLHDVLAFVTREIERSQGGRPADHMDASTGEDHGGYGAREGERAAMLELPVSNVMVESVFTATSDESLASLVDTMIANNLSSIVVQGEGGPVGIVTKTDLLESLTWVDEEPYYIHVFGAAHMDETTWETLSERIAEVVRKDRALGLLEAKVHFHLHKEKLRGRPLVFVRIRLFTDRGTFVGSGEGFGDRRAFSLALDAVERQILEEKTKSSPGKDSRDWASLISADVPPSEW